MQKLLCMVSSIRRSLLFYGYPSAVPAQNTTASSILNGSFRKARQNAYSWKMTGVPLQCSRPFFTSTAVPSIMFR